MDAWDDPRARALRARIALDGLSVGAALAERFTAAGGPVSVAILARTEPPEPWAWPGDAEVAVPLVVMLETRGGIEQSELASALGRRYLSDPTKTYDAMSHWTLAALGSGMPWAEAAASALEADTPLGHGAAVRSAPIGAYFAGDVDSVTREARASAALTDPRPEGQAAAIAVAVAASLAAEMGASRATRSGDALLARTIEHTASGELREALARAHELVRRDDGLERATKELASRPVAFGLFCAARSIRDYAEAVWTSALHEQDRNTSCAVAGGIVALAAGDASIPRPWLLAREPIRR